MFGQMKKCLIGLKGQCHEIFFKTETVGLQVTDASEPFIKLLYSPLALSGGLDYRQGHCLFFLHATFLSSREIYEYTVSRKI